MSEITELTLSDIASKVCEHYQELKEESTEKTSVLFLKAIQKFFNEWAEERDYTIKEFKSAISRIIQRRKRQNKPFQNITMQEEMEVHKGLNKKLYLNGASCFSFTIKQVTNLELAEDSYF